ncbi:DUF5947 family protein [Pararobbsia alpina]|uniref:Uncharacterized protein n=1 Tax=Pararobbsia alpina TaxID=621374 RepID=A0A6S7BTY5_9BURK|nr:DUF5947 family protein [Pararobbsia alpina]CAB3799193.1 hypothetical protein LMG28138_04607 [Pararobbsia alpina]
MNTRDVNAHATAQRGWVAAIRTLTRQAATTPCELCGEPLDAVHPHLVELEPHALRCCCRACALLFGNQQNARYRRVPEHGSRLDGFRLSDELWDALAIPIGIAFFYRDSAAQRLIAMYPGAAGAMQSSLDLGAWDCLVADNPVLETLEPDVEALLVNRVEGAREHFRVPIDQCYALTGVIRARWRGLSGGVDAWRAIHACFAALNAGERLSEGGANA